MANTNKHLWPKRRLRRIPNTDGRRFSRLQRIEKEPRNRSTRAPGAVAWCARQARHKAGWKKTEPDVNRDLPSSSHPLSKSSSTSEVRWLFIFSSPGPHKGIHEEIVQPNPANVNPAAISAERTTSDCTVVLNLTVCQYREYLSSQP